VKTRVHDIYTPLKILDSGFHRNDEKWPFRMLYGTIKNEAPFLAEELPIPRVSCFSLTPELRDGGSGIF